MNLAQRGPDCTMVAQLKEHSYKPLQHSAQTPEFVRRILKQHVLDVRGSELAHRVWIVLHLKYLLI